MNAHGTSTPLGDVNETNATKLAFGDHAKKMVISSTKSMTGHLLGGAGGIEFCLHGAGHSPAVAPPTINIFNQDPECDPDYCANTARDMKIEYAAKNNFGFWRHQRHADLRGSDRQRLPQRDDHTMRQAPPVVVVVCLIGGPPGPWRL